MNNLTCVGLLLLLELHSHTLDPKSRRGSQGLIATPAIPISAMKIHAPGQSNVPAGQNTARQ
jgi:hypothetical protein